MMKLSRQFLADESGATAIEYGLLAAFIAIAIITVLQSIGIELRAIFLDAAAGLAKR